VFDMDWREFFKPTKGKVIFTAVFIIPLLFHIIVFQIIYGYTESPGPVPISLLLLIPLFGAYPILYLLVLLNVPVEFPFGDFIYIPFVLAILVYYYFLASLIAFIYPQIKRYSKSKYGKFIIIIILLFIIGIFFSIIFNYTSTTTDGVGWSNRCQVSSDCAFVDIVNVPVGLYCT